MRGGIVLGTTKKLKICRKFWGILGYFWVNGVWVSKPKLCESVSLQPGGNPCTRGTSLSSSTHLHRGTSTLPSKLHKNNNTKLFPLFERRKKCCFLSSSLSFHLFGVRKKKAFFWRRKRKRVLFWRSNLLLLRELIPILIKVEGGVVFPQHKVVTWFCGKG